MNPSQEPVTAQSASQVTELDIHRLELRFEHCRITRPKQISRLVQSIAVDGLRLPVHVADTGESLILVDGYQRLNAYRQLQHDRIPAFCRIQPVSEALCEWFANQRTRTPDAIEEAWLIQQLMNEGLSRKEIAQQIGKGESWLSRRLNLLSGLSAECQQALRTGEINTWAASRVFVPLARANKADAERLLEVVKNTHFSSRELSLWFQHYQKSRGEKRRRMVEHPRLFLETLKKPKIDVSQDGSSQQWLNELQGMTRHISKLQQRLLATLTPPPDQLLWSQMLSAGQQVRQGIEQLIHNIEASAKQE